MTGSNLGREVISITGGGGFGGGGLSPSLPDKLSTVVDLQTGEILSEDQLNGRPDPTGRKKNPVWDACVEVLGYEPKTKSEKALWGKMTSSLREAEATEETIRSVAEWYKRHWPGIDLTITALEKWYSHFLAMKLQREATSGTSEARLTTWMKNVGWEYSREVCQEEVLAKSNGDYRVWKTMEPIWESLQPNHSSP